MLRVGGQLVGSCCRVRVRELLEGSCWGGWHRGVLAEEGGIGGYWLGRVVSGYWLGGVQIALHEI